MVLRTLQVPRDLARRHGRRALANRPRIPRSSAPGAQNRSLEAMQTGTRSRRRNKGLGLTRPELGCPVLLKIWLSDRLG